MIENLRLIKRSHPRLKRSGFPAQGLKIGNGIYWNERLTEFVEDTFGYLREYYRRNDSENSLGVDKKLLGWKINQKREDRIDIVIFCKVIWRNLFQLYS